ncbi:SWIM zinc finger family protein [Bacillus xiapuensis]|uniref:SWIM zinc finger family protein n=1 Tax=Bacillus xiapuensis TaxID=2014075 RepID=UPI000C2370BA|nr:SWIM zinc finger family protein [Bacillus xiapuensis]
MAVNKQKLDDFSSELKLELRPALPHDQAIIQEGYRIYKDGRALIIKSEKHLIIGEAEELEQSFTVHLDLAFPSFSSCTCPREHWCSHQAAVFFTAYEKEVSIDQWIQEWQTSAHALASIPGVMRASDLLKSRITTEDGPEVWMAHIARTAGERLSPSAIRKNPYLLDYQGRNVYDTLLKHTPAKREWQPLYELFVCCGLLTFLAESLNDSDCSPELLHRSCSAFLFFLVEEAANAAEEIGVHALPFEFDRYIDYLRKASGELLSPQWSVFPNQRIDLYRFLWSFLFKREAWRKEERKRLANEPPNPAAAIAYLHQLYLSNQLELFEKTAEQSPEAGLEFYTFWLHEAFSAKQYGKVRLLLAIMERKLEGYLENLGESFKCRRFVNWLLTHLDTNWLTAKEPQLYKSLLERMLPYSYGELSMHLMETKQFQEWAELQSWIGYDLLELDRAGLKTAAKLAPKEVLPLYHHGVNQLINQRNRDSYKKAVRYLKRLRTLYKKLKRTDRWDLYITALLEDHKRLRAFQEECRKGKLTDA